MKEAIVIEQSDIKKLIAKEYGVDEKQVVKAQYSWIVMKEETK